MNLLNLNLTQTDVNPFKSIGKDWFLLTSGNIDNYNTMTASWGSMGVLWNKNIVTVFIRPQRYTLDFIKQNDYFTLSFFDEKYKDALKFCGSNSGRDVNKAKSTGLSAFEIENSVAFEQANSIFICRKLYCQQLNEESFIDKSLLSNYQNNDYHYAFVGEIVFAYQNN